MATLGARSARLQLEMDGQCAIDVPLRLGRDPAGSSHDPATVVRHDIVQQRPGIGTIRDIVRGELAPPVTIYPGTGNYFEVGANDQAAWVAFLLRRQRMVHGLSLADVAERLGAKSRNAYARYEQGESVPTADKLMKLLAVLEPGRDFVLCEAGA